MARSRIRYRSKENTEETGRTSRMAGEDGAQTPEYEMGEGAVTEQRFQSSEDDAERMLASREYAAKQDYTTRKVFADRAKFTGTSRDVFSTMWSYHSLFPSLRTWVPLIVLATAPMWLMFFGIKIGAANASACFALGAAGIALFFLALFSIPFNFKVSHAVKDSLIHGVLLLGMAILYNWSLGINGYINVAVLYFTGHLIAHGIDFHLERSTGRAWKLTFLTALAFGILIAAGFAWFGLSATNVFV